jgi:hypothetical protein
MAMIGFVVYLVWDMIYMGSRDERYIPEYTYVTTLILTIFTAAGKEEFEIGEVEDYDSDPMQNKKYQEFVYWMNGNDNKLWSFGEEMVNSTYFTRRSVLYFTREIEYRKKYNW